eukprot:4894068-Amphidinium_carterae.1
MGLLDKLLAVRWLWLHDWKLGRQVANSATGAALVFRHLGKAHACPVACRVGPGRVFLRYWTVLCCI